MFVTFEGPEGAGKSSAIRSIAQRLEQQGKSVITTREPGSGEVGAAIRKILLHGDELDSKCELFLFLADRAQHVATVIRPALEAGMIVLCDRYGDSTVVYQGVARNLNPFRASQLNEFATDGLIPDLTLLLDLDPEVGLKRVVDRDRLDSEPIEFHIRVRNGFLALAEAEPHRWVIIDAAQSEEAVSAACESAIRSRFTF